MLKRIIIIIPFIGMLVAIVFILWTTFGPGRGIYEIDIPGNSTVCIGGTRFAVIGDYGESGHPEADVAALVKQWQPEFIVTTGDNNYPNGEAKTIDGNIGRYYSSYIHPYQGEYGPGALENRFYPTLGNHDWRTENVQSYLDYFTLPGNERYYDVRRGPLHFYILDSDENEPDGRTADSVQAQWLAAQMAGSDAPWKIVVLHEPPYSSGKQHGDNPAVQWDFAGMGAAAVLSEHEHLYERLDRDGITYINNGLGGRSRIYTFDQPLEGSVLRYNQEFGAMLVSASDGCLNFSFYNRRRMLVDSHTLTR